ncbi:pseudouridine synthase [Ottowia testudinis]|uniref:Pseudouridine synthase n=1 Tax=Ottowia testudinis TaxID=2816950 RepID=A0A975CIF9_9BURK|nr:pseudouridine synthase [Ottowia testudinis]QTD46940.1 pseudouridine synthase [Ottowia testudinis]
MSRPPRPSHLPLREGVSASCIVVRTGDAPTVLDFLATRLPALPRADWAERLRGGEVLDERGHPLHAGAPCRPGQRVYYYRRLAAEPEPPLAERIVFQDSWLVVADKPHFMPVTPSGRFVQQSLLVRLKRRLGLAGLSPVHRIDRETAGLVVLAVQPHTRGAYQALFRDRRVHKAYEAVAPHRAGLALPRTHRSRLMPDAERFFLSREVPGEPNSETHIERIRVLGDHAVYRLSPVTGQRHQLRLHLQALGVPILGDSFYPQVLRGPGAADDMARPLQLLARELAFDDPVTGERRQFQSSLELAAAQGRWPADQLAGKLPISVSGA